MENMPNVIECSCVTGDYAMLLEVQFANTGELDDFINKLQRFGKTRTQIVFSTAVSHRGAPISGCSTTLECVKLLLVTVYGVTGKDYSENIC